MAQAQATDNAEIRRQRLISFPRALRALGPNDSARGAVLGLSRRCVQAYASGDWPKGLESLMREPDLLRALADDAERIRMEDDQDGHNGTPITT